MQKKRLLASISLIICLCIIGMVACSEPQPEPQDQPIVPQNLATIVSVQGGTIVGDSLIEMQVDKDTETLELKNSIKTVDDCSWKIYKDQVGRNPVGTKVNLNLGNNKFYIIVKANDGSNSNTYLLSVYREYEVTVTYYDGDVEIDKQTLVSPSLFKPNYEYEKTGYTVNYWYYEDGTKVVEHQIVKDEVVYANTTINQYSIIFNSVGGSEIETITQDYATKVYEPIEIPTKEQNEFLGWYELNGNGTIKQEPYTFDTIEARDVNLYAKWKANRFSITFDTNGFGEVKDITQDFGTPVDQPELDRTGYKFLGWFEKYSKEPYVFDKMEARNINLTAKWEPEVYTITIDNGGGFGVTQIVQCYGTELPNISAPIREESIFLGYTYEGEEFEFDGCYLIASNITVVAKWQVNQYSISFDSDSDKEYDTITADFGTAILAPAQPNKVGYKFLGWYVKNEDGTVSDEKYQFVTIEARDIELIAVWEEIKILDLNN